MYSETLADRVRIFLGNQGLFTEQKMFGGLCFLVGGNMACGIVGDELMVRTGPAAHAESLAQPHTRPMDFTGRAMRGMVYVEAGAIDDIELARWVSVGTSFAGSLPAKAPAVKQAKR